MKKMIRFLFHSLPLIPYAFNRNFLAIACLLTVILAYVKVNKLRQQLAETSPEKSLTPEKRIKAKKLLSRCEYLVYLQPTKTSLE